MYCVRPSTGGECLAALQLVRLVFESHFDNTRYEKHLVAVVVLSITVVRISVSV